MIEIAIAMGVKALLAHGAVAAHSVLGGHAAASGGATILGSHVALASNVASLAPQGASTLGQAFSNLTPGAVGTIGHAVIGAAASHATVASALPSAQTVGSVSNALTGANIIELLGGVGIIAVAKRPSQLAVEAIRLLSEGDADMAKEQLKKALKESMPLRPLLKVDNWT